MRLIMGFVSVSSGDKFRVLLASLSLPLISAVISVFRFSHARAILLRASTLGSRIVPGSPSPTRTVWAVEVADRHLPGDRSCLVRSLTSETLLRLYGYTPVHRIGVDPHSNDGFAAHSWLEYGEDVLIGDLEDLSKFDALPPLDGRDEQ
jgi:hypothetical protein